MKIFDSDTVTNHSAIDISLHNLQSAASLATQRKL
jgi:hypothetical protein